MRSARYLIVLLIMMLIPAMVSAYPIPPQPLHKLTKESDLIVIARVIEITERKNRTDSDFASAIARLQISSVVKGSFSNEIVEVPYPADLICPAPPHYEKGKSVLAFLANDEETRTYYTVGLSYGTKSLSRSELDIYSARIREFIEIEKQLNHVLQQQQMVEWFVRCAEESVTRWEGMYGLMEARWLKMREDREREEPTEGEADDETESSLNEEETAQAEAEAEKGPEADSHDKDRVKETRIDLVALLTEEQKRRLTEALYRSPVIDQGEKILLELVREWKDQNLASFLWSYLKAFRADSPYVTAYLMEQLADALSNKEALAVASEFRRVDWTSFDDDAKEEQVRKSFLEKFIAIIERAGSPTTMLISNQPSPEPEEPAIEPSSNKNASFPLMMSLTALGSLIALVYFLKI